MVQQIRENHTTYKEHHRGLACERRENGERGVRAREVGEGNALALCGKILALVKETIFLRVRCGFVCPQKSMQSELWFCGSGKIAAERTVFLLVRKTTKK